MTDIISETKDIRRTLKEGTSYGHGTILRERLNSIAKLHYNPSRDAITYLYFMNENLCEFSLCEPNLTRQPYYLRMVCGDSGKHYYGDCIEECLDQAMDN